MPPEKREDRSPQASFSIAFLCFPPLLPSLPLLSSPLSLHLTSFSSSSLFFPPPSFLCSCLDSPPNTPLFLLIALSLTSSIRQVSARRFRLGTWSTSSSPAPRLPPYRLYFHSLSSIRRSPKLATMSSSEDDTPLVQMNGRSTGRFSLLSPHVLAAVAPSASRPLGYIPHTHPVNSSQVCLFSSLHTLPSLSLIRSKLTLTPHETSRHPQRRDDERRKGNQWSCRPGGLHSLRCRSEEIRRAHG